MDDLSVSSEAGVDDAGALLLAVEGTREFLKTNVDASPALIVDMVANQQMASALKTHDRMQIFVEAAFTEHFFKNKEVEARAPVIQAITQGNPIMERHLIGAVEGFTHSAPKLFPVMIKQLFDEDALEEETILQWAYDGRTEYTLEKVDEDSRARLRAEAEPVINWLQEDDSSDSDSD